MSSKSLGRKLKGIKNGIGSIWSKHMFCRSNSHVALDVTPIEPIQQGQWASLPPELLLDIIRRVEKSETFWPARAVVIFCASVCKSWRSATLEIVKTPQQCGRITFPISVKQPGPCDYPIQCFIRRNKRTSTFLLYLGLEPSNNEGNKLLLAAKKIRRSEFVVSLAADDFSQASNKFVGKVRSNFWCTKFSIYDSQPPDNAAVQSNCRPSGILNSKQVSPRRAPACSHLVGTVSYEVVITTDTPRKINCIMNSIPTSALYEGGNTPTPTSLPPIFDIPFSCSPALKEKSPMKGSYHGSLSELPELSQSSIEPLTLINISRSYFDQLIQCRGRCSARVISIKNFQLGASVHLPHNVSRAELKRVILQFAKIEKDLFIMDYSYPLSAFQAFAICLTSMRAMHL
ncbi:tubby-like F-box protein 5 [Medicago truncatula]|uniref:Tubby-F-box-like protein n=2 Tax=Medicago truncatula TaxID=3880 RepID=A0A072TUE8_MEDTR|nr:tubby-like F-box protein 5 [Medicago truncatula]KEH20443.1 tubby-F-box-like protein [Medicago truncatula]